MHPPFSMIGNNSGRHRRHHHHSQYLFEVVPLLLECQDYLKLTISRIHFSPGRYESLHRLQKSLYSTEELLKAYVVRLVEDHHVESNRDRDGRQRDRAAASRANPSNDGNNHCDILAALEHLNDISVQTSIDCSDDSSSSSSSSHSTLHRHYRPRNPQEAAAAASNHARPIPNTQLYRHSSSSSSSSYIQSRSAESQLLFRLIVVFQLLLVRIDDAHYVITGHRMDLRSGDKRHHKNHSRRTITSSSPWRTTMSLGIGCCLGAGLLVLGRRQTPSANGRSLAGSARWMAQQLLRRTSREKMLGTAAKLGSSLLGLAAARGFFSVCWMTDKIIRSNHELLEWNHQWELILRCTPSESSTAATKQSSWRSRYGGAVGAVPGRYSSPSLPSSFPSSLPSPPIGSFPPTKPISKLSSVSNDAKSKTLIEYAQKQGRKPYNWASSTGEIRFMLVKRFMEIYYASVGVGVHHCTNKNFLPLVAGAVASFYAITGAPPTPTVVNDETSRDLIQHAWGMVSLPVLKDLMLQASSFVKGAAVADRIVFCGVPCFVLSKDPAPELAAVLLHNLGHRPPSLGSSSSSLTNLSRLSTIAETEPYELRKRPERQASFTVRGEYRQRDVILHLTGGGFFAHTIASDLPYLLDWSSSTGAVVICPEYSLLPEHQFPTQLNQIATIYEALASGNTGSELGFVANSIIVTGESAGGNLAAALCVKLALERTSNNTTTCADTAAATKESFCSTPPTIVTTQQQDTPEVDHDDDIESSGGCGARRMPDAIMLSCPALNLTTELSHSRVVGTEDPVLPNALISAICEAYLPQNMDDEPDASSNDNKNPLVSPFYAPDTILRQFPPTLLFASSKDPLLDDSVTFNERLRLLGVDSELVAVHNVPHAYLGLGTAGFPEAVQVQRYAMEWMSSKFS